MSQGKKRNSACPCGSGKKFKYCHSPQRHSQSLVPLLTAVVGVLSVVLLIILWPGSSSEQEPNSERKRATNYSSVPGLQLDQLNASEQRQFVDHLNHTDCICECNMTVAECRNIDPGCDHSEKMVEQLLAETIERRVKLPAASH